MPLFFVLLHFKNRYSKDMPYSKDMLTIKPTEFGLAPGRILISVPLYNDAFFNRSVVLLTDYDHEHAAGLIVNHKLPYSVRQLVNEIHTDEPIFLGGPVQPDALFLIHTFDSCKASYRILPNIYIGYDDILLALIEHHAIDTLHFRFMMGYAGWSPGQLEEEVAKNMWIIANPTSDLIFSNDIDLIWTNAVKFLGDDYNDWLKMPYNLSLN